MQLGMGRRRQLTIAISRSFFPNIFVAARTSVCSYFSSAGPTPTVCMNLLRQYLHTSAVGQDQSRRDQKTFRVTSAVAFFVGRALDVFFIKRSHLYKSTLTYTLKLYREIADDRSEKNFEMLKPKT